MDYRHLPTKHFVKSCQLPDNGYCSILASLAKPVSGLVCASLGVSVVQCSSSDDCAGVLSRCGAAALTKGSRRHPCAPRPQSRTTGVCHSWDFYLLPEVVETQSLGSGGVAVNFPVGMNPQGTSLLQVQEETHPAFLPHCWAVQFGNLAQEERQIATFTLPLTHSREGIGAEWLSSFSWDCWTLITAELWARNRCRQVEFLHHPQPLRFSFPWLQLLPASLSCLIGVINEGVSHPLTRQAYILGLMTLILLMLSLSPFNCFISGVTAGSHLTSDKSQAPAD